MVDGSWLMAQGLVLGARLVARAGLPAMSLEPWTAMSHVGEKYGKEIRRFLGFSALLNYSLVCYCLVIV